MERHLQQPLLKSAKARALLETPERPWMNRHPLISTAIITGAIVANGLLISKCATRSEGKVDADSARVSVSSNSKASEAKERLKELKNILKMRKELKGKISWNTEGEDEEESVATSEGARKRFKDEIFNKTDGDLEELRYDLEDEFDDIQDARNELHDRWMNWTNADAEEDTELSEREKGLEAKLALVANETRGREFYEKRIFAGEYDAVPLEELIAERENVVKLDKTLRELDKGLHYGYATEYQDEQLKRRLRVLDNLISGKKQGSG